MNSNSDRGSSSQYSCILHYSAPMLGLELRRLLRLPCNSLLPRIFCHSPEKLAVNSVFLLCSSLPMFAYVPNKRKRCASCPPNASSPVHASREQSKRLSTPSTCIRSGATGLRLKRISVYEGKDAISATTRWQICHKAKTSIECRDRATADQHFLRCRASMRRGA